MSIVEMLSCFYVLLLLTLRITSLEVARDWLNHT